MSQDLLLNRVEPAVLAFAGIYTGKSTTQGR